MDQPSTITEVAVIMAAEVAAAAAVGEDGDGSHKSTSIFQAVTSKNPYGDGTAGAAVAVDTPRKLKRLTRRPTRREVTEAEAVKDGAGNHSNKSDGDGKIHGKGGNALMFQLPLKSHLAESFPTLKTLLRAHTELTLEKLHTHTTQNTHNNMGMTTTKPSSHLKPPRNMSFPRLSVSQQTI